MYVPNEDAEARFWATVLYVGAVVVFVGALAHPPLDDWGIIKSVVWFVFVIWLGLFLLITVITAIAWGIRAGGRALREEIYRNRDGGRPWLWYFVVAAVVVAYFLIFGAGVIGYFNSTCVAWRDCWLQSSFWWLPAPFMVLVPFVWWIEKLALWWRSRAVR